MIFPFVSLKLHLTFAEQTNKETYIKMGVFILNKPKIVVVGSLNMDMVISMSRMPAVGETLQGQAIHYMPGGKGANQAVASARLGAQVAMIGAVGRDMFGQQLVRNLLDNGVDISAVQNLEGVPTGTATVLHTPEDNCIVVVSGANDQFSEESIKKHRRLIAEADLLLVQLEIPLKTVEYVLQLARECCVTTVLNPAPAQPLSDGLLRNCDYVTPNETELKQMVGRDFSTQEELGSVLSSWEERFGHKLIVTRGEHGCSYLVNGNIQTVPALKVDVVDTTGAGDAFNGGLGFGIASGWTLSEAISFAGKVAGRSVMKLGAQAGMPYSADL
ncbi:ribokinase [Paenibacillus sp.]|uniref:ribokinase n=1 Tax=Paenibacillus sp. TaxID=58172 RepID=UPI0028AA5BE2|nr:ribokinase [Paenibacillus sp.]